MSTYRCKRAFDMRSDSRRGFTLIELLIVIAVIGILAGLLFPVFARVRNSARKTTCASNLHQITVAIQLYAQDNNGRYPQAEPEDIGPTCSGWADRIFPLLQSAAVLQCPANAQGEYRPGCGAQGGVDENGDLIPLVHKSGSYDLNVPFGSFSRTYNAAGEITFFQGSLPANRLIRDTSYLHPSSTILVLDGEGKHVNPGTQQPPFQGVTGLRDYGVTARHDNGCNVAFADGHVKWLSMDQLTDRKWWLLD